VPHAETWPRPSTCGETSPERSDQRLANYWHGDFPWRPRTGLRREVTCRRLPAERLRPLRHGRQRLGMDQ
jgi:hypothetical protein